MGYVGGELVPGRCEDAPCCGCDPSGTEGCVQPGESSWAARMSAIEYEDFYDDFEDDEDDEEYEEYEEYEAALYGDDRDAEDGRFFVG